MTETVRFPDGEVAEVVENADWLDIGKPGEFDTGNSASDIKIADLGPQPNLFFRLGEPPAHIAIGVIEKRTLRNRLKWWTLCRVFPFTVEEWK